MFRPITRFNRTEPSSRSGGLRGEGHRGAEDRSREGPKADDESEDAIEDCDYGLRSASGTRALQSSVNSRQTVRAQQYGSRRGA